MTKCEPYRRLIIAVVNQAFKDAYKGDKEARAWLLQDAPEWLKMADIYVSSKYIELALSRPVNDFRYTIRASRRTGKEKKGEELAIVK
jgi:hypothetical protein